MNQPLLSIGILLGNNCHPSRVTRCMKSLSMLRAALPCQVVVGDLGAEVEIRQAAEGADLLLDIPWTGDISAARNALLDHCTGDWFLALSPNEWLDRDFSELADFFRDSDGAEGACLIQCSHKNDGAETRELSLLRLFRRSTGARYEGALHETITRSLRPERCARLRRPCLHYEGRFYREGFKDAMLPPKDLLELEKAVNQHDGSLEQLNRYVAVCGDGNMRLRCIQSALRLFQWDKAPNYHAASLLRYGIRLTTDPAKVEQWLADGLEHCPDSLFLGMDAHAYAMDLYYRLGRYSRVAECGLRYLAARKRFLSGDYDRAELEVGPLQTQAPTVHACLLVELGDSLARLGRWAEAGAALQCLDRETLAALPGTFWATHAKNLLRRGERLEQGGACLRALWDSADETRREWLLDAVNGLFRPGTRRPGLETLLAGLDAEPGFSVRALQSENREEVTEILTQVRDWTGVLTAVYPHVMRLGAALPEGFYRQQADRLADIAAALPQFDPLFPQTAIAYGMAFLPETSAQLTWLLDLTAAALRVGDPEDTETMEALCSQFQWVAGEYLGNLYHPDLLNEEDLTVLPGLHAFGWCFLQAQKANSRGEGLETVRMLRLGLRLAPGMRRTVDYQVRRIQAALDAGASSPEVLTLAGQIAARVAELKAAGDPGLEELLSSPAYQKFLPVIQRLESAAR